MPPCHAVTLLCPLTPPLANSRCTKRIKALSATNYSRHLESAYSLPTDTEQKEQILAYWIFRLLFSVLLSYEGTGPLTILSGTPEELFNCSILPLHCILKSYNSQAREP
jgi:hypothetical protein